MEAKLDCLSCFLRMGLQAARMSGANEPEQEAIMTDVLELLKNSLAGECPLNTAVAVQQLIKERTGCADPYAKIKNECNRNAEAWLPSLTQTLKDSTDQLMMALKIAAIGNIIDYGAFSHFDLEALIANLTKRDFALNRIDRFKARISKAKKIAYLADNAGEIVFDQLLIEFLCQHFPLERILLVIRKDPFINDVSSLEYVPKALLSIPQVQVAPLSVVPHEDEIALWDDIRTSDLIISKGMANYEKFSDYEDFFFLLISKCDLVSETISAKTKTPISTGDWIFL